MQLFDEFVGGTILSAVAPVTSEWLSRVGTALDGAGTWRPTRGGGRDPGRSKVSDTAAALTEWFESWTNKRDGMWFFSDEKKQITGRIDAFAPTPTLRGVHFFNKSNLIHAKPCSLILTLATITPPRLRQFAMLPMLLSDGQLTRQCCANQSSIIYGCERSGVRIFLRWSQARTDWSTPCRTYIGSTTSVQPSSNATGTTSTA